jgi:formylglycine-generating enzyme required for sulfatase activity
LITVVMLALALVGSAGWWFGIEQPKRAETARVARAKADAEQRQRQEVEAARVVEEARKKKEADDAVEKERLRLAKEKADADEKQRQMAAEAAAAKALVSATKEKPFVNNLGMKFVPVPITGGPTDGKRVLFGVWDVRVRDYREFAEETKREWVKPSFTQNEEHPAVMVSWDDAKSFCAWLTKGDRDAGKLGVNEEYRLPSDHEWSCAVGIGERENATASPKDKNGKIDHVFPWGTQWPPPKGAGNYGSINGYDDGYANTSPVGSFSANQYGLYDMSGNVWQWCEDFWESGSTRARVLRGGSWYFGGELGLRSSGRNYYRPAFRDDYYGFRCVLVVSGG